MERTPDLVVDSVTGVEVSLPVAGPGARSFAFLVDWHIRVILAVAWYVVAALLYNGRPSLLAPLNASAQWYVFVITPPAAIYFLYHSVLEIAMHGRTPGKRMAGVHIVARDGGAPGVGALLTRNVFRLVDSLPVFYGVGLITTIFTRDHVRIGDMAAGTLLVYNRTAVDLLAGVSASSPVGQGSKRGKLDPATAEVANEILSRWTALDSGARHRLAHRVLARGGIPDSEISKDEASLRTQLEQLARGSSP
jgi:uncharacterized RDD family membrane protein YckC